MNRKKIISLIIGICIIGLSAGVAYLQIQSSGQSVSREATATRPIIPAKASEKQMKTYVLADVSRHGDVSSCWTVVNGGMYDLTSWVSRHPGGSGAISKMCGIDSSAVFNQKHGGQQRQESELATFRIGTVSK